VKNQLLPEGFRDSLPELALKEDKINSIFIQLMQKNGFVLVKPPLLEFESTLFFLLNNNEESDSFRVLDPISQKMMGLRTDITVQIARISSGSLIDLPRPLKICYCGDILKVNNTNLNLSRQAIQIGSEIIGTKNNNCESEIIGLISETLKSLKIKNFFFNFTMPTLISSIEKDFSLSNTQLNLIKQKFKNKNPTDLEKISNKLKEISDNLIDSVGSAREKLKQLKQIKFTKFVQKEINTFIKIVQKITINFPDIEVYIDPLEIDDSDYHTGVAFKVFSENLKELFRGGNYKVSEENCIGFSGFTESLVNESLLKFSPQKKIYVPINIEINEKKNLQNKGFVTLQALNLQSKNKMINEAKKHQCNFYFFDKHIYKLD